MKIDMSRILSADDKAARALGEARSMARAQVIAAIDAASERVTGRVPLTEMLSWGTKEQAARSWIEGRAMPEEALMIEGEAAVTGEAPDGLAERILRNADVYRSAVAALTGLRRSAETAIALARSPEEVAQILRGVTARLDAPGLPH
jgi:hypothetical protein